MKSFVEFTEENLPGQRTHIMNKDVRHPEHGIITNGTTLRHTGKDNYEVRAGRAKGNIISIPSEHVNKMNEGYEDHHLFPDYMQKILKKHEQDPQEKAKNAARAVAARANAKPVDRKAEPYKPLGGRDEKSGRSYSEEVVAEGAPIVVMPRSDRFGTKKPAQPYRNQGDIVPPTKPPSTEKRGVKGRPGQRPMPEHVVAEESELGDLAHPLVTKHRFLVTYSDPNHTMVSKRKEKQQKHILVPGSDKKGSTIFKGDAEPLVKKYMNKQGLRVHEVEHVGMVTKRSGK